MSVLAEGANGPTTPEADTILDARRKRSLLFRYSGKCGGVIVSYFEWVQDLQQFFWSELKSTRSYSLFSTAFNAVMQRAEHDTVSHALRRWPSGLKKVALQTSARLFP